MEPILPFSAARLREMLQLKGVRPSTPGGTGMLGWDDAGRPLLAEGHTLGKPEILFEKIEDEVMDLRCGKSLQALPSIFVPKS